MVKKVMLYVIIFFGLYGIIASSFMFHEFVHLYRMKEPTDICMSIGGSDYEMYVKGAPDTQWNSLKEEVLAYSSQISFVILLSYMVLIYFIEERNKR